MNTTLFIGVVLIVVAFILKIARDCAWHSPVDERWVAWLHGSGDFVFVVGIIVAAYGLCKAAGIV